MATIGVSTAVTPASQFTPELPISVGTSDEALKYLIVAPTNSLGESDRDSDIPAVWT